MRSIGTLVQYFFVKQLLSKDGLRAQNSSLTLVPLIIILLISLTP